MVLLSRTDPAALLDEHHRLDWREHVHADAHVIELLDRLVRPSPLERPRSATEARELIVRTRAALPPRMRGPLTLT